MGQVIFLIQHHHHKVLINLRVDSPQHFKLKITKGDYAVKNYQFDKQTQQHHQKVLFDF